MDTVISTLAAGTPASVDGRGPCGSRHTDQPDAFGAVLAGALDTPAPDRRGTATASPYRRPEPTANDPATTSQSQVDQKPTAAAAGHAQAADAQGPAAGSQTTPGRHAALSTHARTTPAAVRAKLAQQQRGNSKNDPATAQVAAATAVAAADDPAAKQDVDAAAGGAAKAHAGRNDGADESIGLPCVPTEHHQLLRDVFRPVTGAALPAAGTTADALCDAAAQKAGSDPAGADDAPQVPAAASGSDASARMAGISWSAASLLTAATGQFASEALPADGSMTRAGGSQSAAAPLTAATGQFASETLPADLSAGSARAAASSSQPAGSGANAAGNQAVNARGIAPGHLAGRAASFALASSFFDPVNSTDGAAAAGSTTLTPIAGARLVDAPSGDVASFVRATLSRYVAAASPASDPGSAAGVTSVRPAGLSLPVLTDYGSAVTQAVADDSQASAAVVAEAARVPFQLGQADTFDPPLWARNELAKAAQWGGDVGVGDRLTRFTAGLGDHSSSSSEGQQNQARDGGSGAAALAYAAGFGMLGSGSTASLDGSSFQASIGRAVDVPAEPTTESGSLTHSIVRVVKLQATEGGGEIQLRLRPEHLGDLTVTVRVEAGAVSAALRSDSPEVRAWIQQHEQDLRAGLKEQGLSLEQLTVDPEGQQQQQGDTPQDGSERRPTNRRQDAPERFEALL